MKTRLLILSIVFTITVSTSFSQGSIRIEKNDSVDLFFRMGNINSVVQAEINPDGKTFATLDASFMIVLWDAKTQLQLITINGKDDEISIIRFTLDGKFIIGTGTNKDGLLSKAKSRRLIYWDAYTGAFMKAVNLESTIRDMIFTPDGRIASFEDGFGGTKLVYRDQVTGQIINQQKIGGLLPIPDNFAFSPDGKYLMVGTNASAASAKNIAKDIGKMALSSLVGRKDQTKEGYLIVQSLETNKIVKEIYISASKTLTRHPAQMKFSPDGRFLLMGGAFKDGASLKVLDMGTLEIVNSINNGQNIQGLEITKDGQYFYTSSPQSTSIQKWNLKDCKIIETNKITNGVSDIILTPDGNQYISVGGNILTKTNDIRIWDVATNKQIGSFEGLIATPNNACFNRDGKQMLIGSMDGQAQLIDLTSGTLLKTFDVSNDSIKSKGFGKANVRFSSDGKYIITSLSSFMAGMAQNTKIWDAHSFKLIREYNGYGQAIVSPISNRIVLAKLIFLKTEVSIWDFDANSMLFSDKFIGTQLFEYSPDGKTFATSKISGLTAASFRLWDATNMKEVLEPKKMDINASEAVMSVRYSPDGSKIAVSIGSQKKWRGRVYEFDVNTKQIIRMYFESSNTSPMYACYSPDGKYLVTGESKENQDSKIRIFDANSGTCLDSMLNSGFPIQFSKDGKYLIAATGNIYKNINIIDFENRRVTLSYYKINGKDDCILITPDKYYKITPNAYDAVAFKKGDKLFPFEQFDLKFNRPDLIVKQLPYGNNQIADLYQKAREKRLQKLGFSIEDYSLDINAPIVKINNATKIPISSPSKTLELNISATDANSNISSLQVWVNDVPIGSSAGISNIANKSKAIDKTISITLSSGRNKIQVVAINDKGVESYKETVFTNYVGQEDKNDLYAIVIGVSNYSYSGSDYDLTYASKDASDIATFLESQNNQYKQMFITKLLDGEATKEKITATKSLLMKSTVDDNVILFFAGHGLLDDKLNYYFATADIDFTKPALRGLPYDQMESILDGIPARKKLMLIDACNSGEVDKEDISTSKLVPVTGESGGVKSRGFKKLQSSNNEQVSSFSLMQQLFTDLRRNNGAVVISSASGKEFAFESSQWNNGVFTYSLLSGLKSGKADNDFDKVISVSEVRDYVGIKVAELTEGNQNPTARQVNLYNDFAIIGKGVVKYETTAYLASPTQSTGTNNLSGHPTQTANTSNIILGTTTTNTTKVSQLFTSSTTQNISNTNTTTNISSADMCLLAQKDSKEFYRGKHSGSKAVLFMGPFGIIPTLVCNRSFPEDKNLNIPKQELMGDLNYLNCYKEQAKKTKKKKFWKNFAISNAFVVGFTILGMTVSP